jgi:hypothetical protein
MRTIVPARLFIAVVIFSSITLGQTAKNTEETLKHKYHVVQVGSFEVQPGVDIPADFVAGLPPAVAHALKESKIFREVLLQDQTSSEKTPVLRLSGTVTGFEKGNRAKRYFGVGGAGAARIFITLVYVNGDDGQALYEDKIVGTLSSGVFGGESNKVANELAKSVVATTKLMLLRPVPSISNVAVTPPVMFPTSKLVERQVLPIKASDLSGAQQEMNRLAAAGYRFTNLKITGNSSAEVTMEKSATPPQTYQYLLLHAYSPGNVQKNLNKGAADGYRLSPHTLAALSGFSVIMEKPPVPPQIRYEYRFRYSLRQSNAEKNVVEDQAQGFTLAESGELLGYHVVIMEKTN